MGQRFLLKRCAFYATICLVCSKRGIQYNSMKRLTFLILLVFLLPSTLVQGQSPMSHSKRFTDNWYINGNVGVSQFYGDMSNENPFQKLEFDTRVGTGLILGKNITPYLGVRGEIHYARLQSTRRFMSGYPNGAYFVSKNLVEFNLAATVNFVNLVFGYNSRRVFTAYGLVGAGLANWQAELFDHKTNKKIQDNGFTGNGIMDMTTEFVLPFGAGVNFKVSDRFDVNTEVTWRGVNSDKLDTKTGGFEYDIYSYISVGLTYKFNLVKKAKEPVPEIIEEEEPLILQEETEVQAYDIPEPDDKKEPIEIIRDPVQDKKEDAGTVPAPAPEIPELEFRVQIRASYAKPVPPDEILSFGVPDRIKEELSDGWYRYTVGSFDNLASAADYRDLIRTSYGISDAFVVAYRKGERMKSLRYLDNTYTADGFNVLEEKLDNIRYGVQLAASYLVPIPVEKIRETYDIDEPIREDVKDGWYRYSVGSFDMYWKAKEYRNILLTRNNAKGSFVIAYKDERRYTIIELLGIDPGETPEEMVAKPKRDVVFTIQLLCLDPAVQIPANDLKEQYGLDHSVKIVNEDGLVKYQIGNVRSYKEASLLRDEMINKGINDAFVVPYENGKRISITDAFQD